MINIMDYIPEDKKRVSNITVVGVGGGGSNAVEYMYDKGIKDVEFIICNTDVQALSTKRVPLKISIGQKLTQGMGAGADPKVGHDSALESDEDIRQALESKHTRMVFITAGMGGGTGTGAAPIIARIAREMGILAVGIVTMPLRSEGKERMRRAKEGLAELMKYLDAILIIDNGLVLKIFEGLTWKEAFNKADDILATAAQSLAEILIKADFHINVDFRDVCKTMSNKNIFLIGTAKAKSSDPDVVDKLLHDTLSSPLLMQNDITGAKNILLSLTNGANGFPASKTDEILTKVQDTAGGDAEMITAMGDDLDLDPDEVKLTILATGFESNKALFAYNIGGDEFSSIFRDDESDDNYTTGNIAATTGDGETADEEIKEHDVKQLHHDENLLHQFETIPSYIRLNKDIHHHIDPVKKKVIKLKTIED